MFTIGYDDEERRNEPSGEDARRVFLAKPARFRRRHVAHGDHLEILPPQQIGVGQHHHDGPDAEQQRRQQRQVDQQHEEPEAHAGENGSRRRQCPARRIPRIVPALHQFGDVVEIQPREQRHGGRHEKEHAGEEPEAGQTATTVSSHGQGNPTSSDRATCTATMMRMNRRASGRAPSRTPCACPVRRCRGTPAARPAACRLPKAFSATPRGWRGRDLFA
jgi:hypothetical protein